MTAFSPFLEERLAIAKKYAATFTTIHEDLKIGRKYGDQVALLTLALVELNEHYERARDQETQTGLVLDDFAFQLGEIEANPVPVELFCPKCTMQHIDEDEWATAQKAHRKHLCAGCGNIWKPYPAFTVGVASRGA